MEREGQECLTQATLISGSLGVSTLTEIIMFLVSVCFFILKNLEFSEDHANLPVPVVGRPSAVSNQSLV